MMEIVVGVLLVVVVGYFANAVTLSVIGWFCSRDWTWDKLPARTVMAMGLMSLLPWVLAAALILQAVMVAVGRGVARISQGPG